MSFIEGLKNMSILDGYVLFLAALFLIFPSIGALLGGLLGYLNWKIAIPVGIVWSIIPIPIMLWEPFGTVRFLGVIIALITALIFTVCAVVFALIKVIVKQRKVLRTEGSPA